MAVDFAKKRGPGRPKGSGKKSGGRKVVYNRSEARKRYLANRTKRLKDQFKRYHSDAKYREKKRRAARLYAKRRRMNGGKPFYATGRKGGKKPNAPHRALKRLHKPNKRAPGGMRPGRKAGSGAAKKPAGRKAAGRKTVGRKAVKKAATKRVAKKAAPKKVGRRAKKK